MLNHANPAIRARACDALAGVRDRDAVALLRRTLLSDTDDHVREEAAVALGRLSDRSAVADLIWTLERDRSEHVREEAALALGRLGQERAVPHLLGAMRDSHTMVHRAAAEALELLGPQAVAELVAVAEHERGPAGEAARAALRARAGLRPQGRRGAL
jgi:HEAT repeat protein